MFKILLVEDEKKMRQLLKKVLVHENYDVMTAKDGEQALELFYQENFDLVILDWMMPKFSGVEVAKQIKKELPMKIIMFTAKNMPEDEVQALLSGVDDYLIKPFHAKLLLVRVSKILGTLTKEGNHILSFYHDTHKAMLGSKELNLTKKEYDLLYYLYNNQNLVLSREQLLRAVWGMDSDNDERTVDSFIRTLRDKIVKEWIKTIYGIGYQFENQEE
ncbi:response regulator transcription factor [Lactococcus petauri]|uniref:response regulator transcription factor n=1 Tax=Lactococcus petauri TaxID=1940789 RepID=UPI0018AC13DE|nr:response regulator transcription factor [Lactococcus petauri]MDC0827075.1 response regulator transcription factor [Lactococcus petauri]